MLAQCSASAVHACELWRNLTFARTGGPRWHRFPRGHQSSTSLTSLVDCCASCAVLMTVLCRCGFRSLSSMNINSMSTSGNSLMMPCRMKSPTAYWRYVTCTHFNGDVIVWRLYTFHVRESHEEASEKPAKVG